MMQYRDAKGVILLDILPQGQCINAARYCSTLDRLKEAIRRKRPGLLRRGVVLQHDNATPHSANLTQQWLQRYGWEILPHPAHNPDLAPSDFHLFGPLKRHLGGMAFETEDDLISELRDWFDNLDVDFFRAWKYGSEGHFTCLLEFTSLSSYQNATIACNALGGFLASVRTAEELAMVQVLANKTSMWLGLDDIEEEGVFIWQEDGEKLTVAEYNAVFPVAPNNFNDDQNCIEFREYTLGLNDWYCDYHLKALCEIPPLPGVC
ncbi:histone-lysine N-methyltransferase SETMAR [Plakobranchus ocellatus]|uniref:Histone-lysine N-methyltransferase SETMAR n=1 Tax=Plakobranchus ocellatus TaxID=259542 RepID=A0AAV4DHX6_9GAST|nr:histone-lysine N-methyltransferase SETMAR [Plakobranchus ocellatus]